MDESDSEPVVTRTRLKEFYSYTKDPKETIQEAYTKSTRMAQQIVTAVPDAKVLMTEKWVFQQLLTSLPSEYSAVRDGIDSAGIEIDDINVAFQRLEEKEGELARKPGGEYEGDTAQWERAQWE